jgi:hypothetical protein
MGKKTGRIGGWGRIAIVVGIVLSIVWTGVMLVRSSDEMRALRLAIADDRKKSCVERSTKTGEDCSTVWLRTYSEAEQRDRELPALIPEIVKALIPVLAAWLIVYGIISAIRWVSEGFSKDSASRRG